MKKALIVVGIVVVLLVAVVVALPFFIDANQFKPTLEAQLSEALGRKVAIGNIQLAIWSGSVSVDNVLIADDPAFSRSPFLTAKSLRAGVALMPLISERKLQVISLTIDEPQVALIRAASGKWNFSSLGAGASKPKSTTSSGSPNDISVQKFALTNGKMTVSEPGSKVRSYDNVGLVAENLAYTSQFPFQFSANTPGQGSIKLDGQAGPVNATDASMTPFHANVVVSHFDLSSTGFVDPASGLGGLVDFNGKVESDGRQMTSKGTMTGQSLKLVAGSSPSTVPVNIDYDASYDPKKEAGVLKQSQVRVGKALANLAGTFDAAGAVPSLNMKMAGQGMSVPDLEGVLPAVAVKLPSGATLQSGTLDTTLTISGPLDRLVIAGPVTLSNAKMTGFSLKGALGALSSFAGLGSTGGSDTEIQTLHTDLRVDPQGQHAQNLNLVVPTIGTVTGAGDATAAGDLNCKMVAMLTGTSGAAGALGSMLGSNAKSGIPFKIQGTTSHPVFVPDMAGVAKGLLNGVGSNGSTGSSTGSSAGDALSNAIGGLFGKKKTQ